MEEGSGPTGLRRDPTAQTVRENCAVPCPTRRSGPSFSGSSSQIGCRSRGVRTFGGHRAPGPYDRWRGPIDERPRREQDPPGGKPPCAPARWDPRREPPHRSAHRSAERSEPAQGEAVDRSRPARRAAVERSAGMPGAVRAPRRRADTDKTGARQPHRPAHILRCPLHRAAFTRDGIRPEPMGQNRGRPPPFPPDRRSPNAPRQTAGRRTPALRPPRSAPSPPRPRRTTVRMPPGPTQPLRPEPVPHPVPPHMAGSNAS
jgi:hypothetical protein